MTFTVKNSPPNIFVDRVWVKLPAGRTLACEIRQVRRRGVSAMRAFLALLFVSASAHATLLHVEIENSLAPPSLQDWRLPGPLPSQFTVSFDLDTLSADHTSFLFGSSSMGPPGTCLLRFDYQGLNITNIAASADGMTLWQNPALNARFRGDNPGSCPGGFFGALDFQDPTARFGMSPDVSPGMSEDAFLHSDDPLRDLLVGFERWPGTSNLLGDWGQLVGGPESVRVVRVPEPASGLLLAGALPLLATISMRRRRRAAA